MIAHTRALIILALLFSVTPLSASAQRRQPPPQQQQERTIKGRAQTTTGASVAWIIVRLLNNRSEPVSLAVTNNTGEFLFSGLREINYQVVIAAPGHQTATEKISFAAGRANPVDVNGVRVVNITLSPERVGRAPVARQAFTQNVPAAARGAFERALKFGRAGRRQVASTLVQEAIRIFPDYFDARFALSSELAKAGRYEEAIIELEHAIRINPLDDRVYQSFGLIMMKQGKYEVAAAVFAEAARLNETESMHPLMRAEALIDYASTMEAVGSPQALIVIQDAFNEAERNLNLASAKSSKGLAAVHFQLARLYQKRGERARAADELDQYLLANPSARNADEIRDVIRTLRTPPVDTATPQPPQ
ncbi:MAG TPA: carboxypeptidase regulatory-like domain-containing protein [Pyrinomonadaceae bacterium]|jgi:tetratricopeptide (TPR) repeat protein|nr:carboxypeptidase regulatory-like domain-containing protein [Pyrinomonadaceae bacterium]